MVNPLTSPLSGIVEPVFPQDYKGSLMHHPAESVQIGHQITQIILTSPDPQTLLARIAGTLGERFQVDCCLIGVVADPAVKTQIALWCAEDHSPLLPGYQAQLWQHPLVNVDGSEEEVLTIRDIYAYDYWSAAGGCWQVLPARSVLKIHTRFQSSVNGVIILGRQEPHEWTNEEKELLKGVTQSVAVAIAQVHLTQQALVANRHRTLLNQLSQIMGSPLNLDDILHQAIAATAQALQVDHGMLLLLKDRPAKHLTATQVTVASEWLEENPPESSARLLNQSFCLAESALCQEAFNNAPQPIAIADQRYTPIIDLESHNFSIIEAVMMPAFIIVPLVEFHHPYPSQEAPVLGFLLLQHRQPRSWHDDELELVTWVSTQLSTRIIQHQTLKQLQSLVEDRTAQLQESLAVQAKLYEKTAQQVQQLRELNQLKEDFISTMNHELRTPLTSMSLAIRMLRQPKLTAKRREKYLEILEQQCNQEIELINDLLSLQQLESNPSQIQAQTIDLIVLINQLAKSFEAKWASKRLTLRIDSPAPSVRINTDPDSLNRILLELLTNAGKYSEPDTTVCLQVTHPVQPSLNPIVLTLTNIGSGISPTDLNSIFEKFRRGEGVTQQAVQGTGLGLALVKCLVNHLNGRIEVTSCPLEHSSASVNSFTLTLPQLEAGR